MAVGPAAVGRRGREVRGVRPALSLAEPPRDVNGARPREMRLGRALLGTITAAAASASVPLARRGALCSVRVRALLPRDSDTLRPVTAGLRTCMESGRCDGRNFTDPALPRSRRSPASSRPRRPLRAPCRCGRVRDDGEASGRARQARGLDLGPSRAAGRKLTERPVDSPQVTSSGRVEEHAAPGAGSGLFG
jgi:hypothetical protein